MLKTLDAASSRLHGLGFSFLARPTFWRSLAEYLLLFTAWAGSVVAAFALARVLGTDAVGPHHRWLLQDSSLLAAGVGAAVASLVVWWYWHTGRLRRHLQPLIRLFRDAKDVSVPMPKPWVAPVEPSEQFDLRSLVLLVIDPSRFSTRAVEKVTVGDGVLYRRLTREFTLPGKTDRGTKLATPTEDSRLARIASRTESGIDSLLTRLSFREEERTFLLPVLRLRRGVLVDNLEIKTHDGRQLNALNINEYYGLIEFLVKLNFLALTETTVLSEEAQKGINKLVLQARFAADRPDEDESVSERTLAWVEEIPIPPSWTDTQERYKAWHEWKERYHDFCRAISEAYIVFVPFDGRPDQRVVLDCLYTEPARLSRRGFGLRDRTRYHLGLRPHEHRFVLRDHRWVQSYHLEFTAPYDQYVHECYVRGLTEDEDPASAGNLVTYSANGLQGSDYAHIYVREVGREKKRERSELAVELDCREKPPGMLGNVMVIALTEAVLIWVIGWHHNRYFGHRADNVTADLPALLLAAPGLVVGWVGVQITGERLRSTSLATIFGLILCGLIAIFSTALALFKATGAGFPGRPHIDHPYWLALMLISAVVAIDLFLRLWIKSRRFLRLIRDEPDTKTEFA